MITLRSIGLALLLAIGCSSGSVRAEERRPQPGKMGGLLGVESSANGTGSSGADSQQAQVRSDLVQWNISGGALREAYYRGYVVTGEASDGSGGRWIYFRRVVSWDGYGSDDFGCMASAVVTIGPELYVYYP